jgi:hypothetical protein
MYHKLVSMLNYENLFLHPGEDLVPLYSAWRYQRSEQLLISFSGDIRVPDHYTVAADMQIVPITEAVYNDVIRFDQSVSGIDRSGIFKLLFKSDLMKVGQCIYINGNIQGFIIIDQNGKGNWQISACQAEHIAIAKALLFTTVSKHLTEGDDFNVYCSSLNQEACASLYRDFGLTELRVLYQGMYTKHEMKDIAWHKVYGMFRHMHYLL